MKYAQHLGKPFKQSLLSVALTLWIITISPINLTEYDAIVVIGIFNDNHLGESWYATKVSLEYIKAVHNMENYSSTIGYNSILNMTTMLYTNFSAFLSNEKYANILEHTDTVLFCISLVLTPVTIIGNIMVHISMYKFRNLRTVTNMFIASLAMADCILGLFTLPL